MSDCFITTEHEASKRERLRFYHDPRAEMQLIKVYPEIKYQTILGFGASFTESAAYVFAHMEPDMQDRFINLCFSSQGNNYTLCRTHIQSCDFSLGNKSYVRKSNNKKQISFSIDQDLKLLVPFIQCALELKPNLNIIASPWSPPAFMKSTKRMNKGGRLKEAYYDQWADSIVRYLQAYDELGIHIDRITVQNEPQATQSWESCLFTAEEEVTFAVNHLRPALDNGGLKNVKLFIWDHNKDCIVERMEVSFDQRGAQEAIQGIAYHWYSGDHFEALDAVARLYPDKELLHTEGCVEYSNSAQASQVDKAERYAHDIIGDLKAGSQGYIDWNILLDDQGGPNHARNYCDAPLMYDIEENHLHINQTFFYLGHFSRFIKPGAQRCLTSSYSAALETVGFVNPDKSRVVVILNRTDHHQEFKVMERESTAPVSAPPHSILTLCW